MEYGEVSICQHLAAKNNLEALEHLAVVSSHGDLLFKGTVERSIVYKVPVIV